MNQKKVIDIPFYPKEAYIVIDRASLFCETKGLKIEFIDALSFTLSAWSHEKSLLTTGT